MSEFVVKYGDGSLHQVPVMYGDADRQVASIIRQNSENIVNSVPRISIYVASLALDRERLADQTFVSKVNIRERDTVVDDTPGSPTYGQLVYTQGEGKNYTIERLMPTPFDLKMKMDIWSSSTDQKLQILEQILVLFNPSLELQTSDNYIDWTSLSVLNLNDISWSSRQVPVGNDTPIDIATITLQTPIWINPPVKVKRLGVITKIVASINNNSAISSTYIEGLGQDPIGQTVSVSQAVSQDFISIGGYKLQVQGNQAILLGAHESVSPTEPTLNIPIRQGVSISWQTIFSQYPGKYIAGSTQIYLTQPNGTQIVGTVALNPLDETVLQVNWNVDTLIKNTGIDSEGLIEHRDPGYAPSAYRNGQPGSAGSPGTFDAIINPQTYNPYRPTGKELADQPLIVGLRFLLVEDIGHEGNGVNGAEAWEGTGNQELIAHANDIIEWDGTQWNVIFNSSQDHDTMIWQTNTYTGVQYLWDGIQWKKSFEGEYGVNQWRVVL
jgi:hypothetical protein